MQIQDIEGRFGFVNVHLNDAALHGPLSAELAAQGRTAIMLAQPLMQGDVRRGELRLADDLAKQALDQGVDVLVTPALQDHPDHDAAAFIGRRAAISIANLGLLELLPFGRRAITVSPPSTSRSAAQPLTAGDFDLAGRSNHQPPPSTVTYLWTSPAHQAYRVPILVERP